MKVNQPKTLKPRKLRALRLMKGVTIDEFAEAVGISISSARKYESNVRRPKDDIKKAICQYYGVSVDELFYKEESGQ